MKILRKQKKNKSSITMRSISAIWLVAYLLNVSIFNVDTSNFNLNHLLSFQKELTGKYNYEVKNDKSCIIKYESHEQTGKNTYKTKFDKGIVIKNKLSKIDNKYSRNELSISTSSDSAPIGTFTNYNTEPVSIDNILRKVISKKDFNVYYLNIWEENKSTLSLRTKVIVVLKNGTIKVLDKKDFTDNFITEKDKKIKRIKELIMKNEIAKFFDSNMFATSFEGLRKLDGEREMLNTILTEYENSTSAPTNVKEAKDMLKRGDYKVFSDLVDDFKWCFDTVLFENGHKINTMCDGYMFLEKNTNDIIDKFGKENLTKKGCSYNFKDIIFSYSDTNPKELLEVAVKKPILYLDDIQLIGANFNEIYDKIQYYILDVEIAETDKGEIKIVEVPEGWTLIVDANGIIKAGVFHSEAYYKYAKNGGVRTSLEKLKLYDNEIKDFSLYE